MNQNFLRGVDIVTAIISKGLVIINDIIVAIILLGLFLNNNYFSFDLFYFLIYSTLSLFLFIIFFRPRESKVLNLILEIFFIGIPLLFFVLHEIYLTVISITIINIIITALLFFYKKSESNVKIEELNGIEKTEIAQQNNELESLTENKPVFLNNIKKIVKFNTFLLIFLVVTIFVLFFWFVPQYGLLGVALIPMFFSFVCYIVIYFIFYLVGRAKFKSDFLNNSINTLNILINLIPFSVLIYYLNGLLKDFLRGFSSNPNMYISMGVLLIFISLIFGTNVIYYFIKAPSQIDKKLCINKKVAILLILILVGVASIFFWNRINQQNLSKLPEVAKNGNSKDLKALINAGADVNAEDSSGETPLILASYNNNLATVEELIKSGADVNAKDLMEQTPLMLASGKGHLDIVKELIKDGADVNAEDINKLTPLMTASHNGYLNIVEELIKSGADVNVKKINGETALILACENGSIDVIKKLIKSGADVNAKNFYGETALDIVFERGDFGIVNELIKGGANSNKSIVLVNASFNNDINTVKKMVQAGADVNIQNFDKWTALMYASDKGYLDIVKELIRAGANVNTTNSIGWTALMYASTNGNTSIVQVLKDAGAKE
ncbi:MAG: ankyrin repeat domain-containing protein [Candidatus Paceibacterota bacterium]